MSGDCEVYVDPEEDEVFFGCISDREKNICARLSQNSGIGKGVSHLNEGLNSSALSSRENNKEVDDEDGNKNEHVESMNNSKRSINDSDLSFKDTNTTLTKTPEFNQSLLNNTAVESEHNYFTPMNHKIDKTILTTPKSVVKADRDGGFLKVLSEIAIVKAEVEADKKIEEEDKENKIIPGIIVTEATPEKAQYVSPPKSNNSHSRRFRIIYNSPKNEDNVENKITNNKLVKDNFENSQNIINKSLDNNGKDNYSVKENRKSTELHNESIALIDLNDSKFCTKQEITEIKTNKLNNSQIQEAEVTEEKKEVDNNDSDVVFIEMKSATQNQKIEEKKNEETEKVDEKPVSFEEIDKEMKEIKEKLNLNTESNTMVENLNENHDFVINSEAKSEIVVEKPEELNTAKEVLNLDVSKTDMKNIDSVEVLEKSNVLLEAENSKIFEEVVDKECKTLPEAANIETAVENIDKCEIVPEEKEKFEAVIKKLEDKCETVTEKKEENCGDVIVENDEGVVKSTELNDCKPESSESDLLFENSLPKPPEGVRFSKEARKIVELLKKSAVDEITNSIIDEVEENSFISPENISLFDTTATVPVIPEVVEPPKPTEISENFMVKNLLNKIVENVVSESSEGIQTKTPKKYCVEELALKTPKFTPKSDFASSIGKEKDCGGNKVVRSAKSVQKFATKIKPPINKLTHQPYTVDKDKLKFTPITSQSKIASIKYFSDRKVNTQITNELKKCVKKLPMEDKKEDKTKGIKETNTCSSKIPVFGLKTTKTVAAIKNTPSKTPIGKTYKNPKYKNIESPINAYINNKTTPLVVNVKPEEKKDGITKILKTQISKNLQERPKTAPLPFVEYRSATPYKVEKKPESRLPRLAPAVQKLIGSNSPTVLKHEGRFYMKNAGKPISTNDSTVLGDPNEVSLLVCQTAQKTKGTK